MSMVTLIPARLQRYGQDFRQRLAIERIGLTSLHQPGPRAPYSLPPSETELLISFNPEHKEDADALEANTSIGRIVHHQLRLSYLDSQTKKNGSLREYACRSLRAADRIIVPANFMVNDLSSFIPEERICVIRNGADENIFRPITNEQREIHRTKIGVKSHEILTGYIGSLTPSKGFQILRNVIKALPGTTRMLVRTYAENNSEKIEELKKLGKDRLILDLDDHSEQARMHHPTPFLDVLLATSLCETVSMVVVEALLCGVPVITSGSTPFFKELSQDGFDSNDLEVISLPSGIDSLERSCLVLEENDAQTISDKFLSRLACKQPVYFTERSSRGNRSKQTGLTASDMLSKFNKLYDAELLKINN